MAGAVKKFPFCRLVKTCRKPGDDTAVGERRSGVAEQRAELKERAVAVATQPVEAILARNLIAGIELAAFIIDPDGVIVFFNESAGDLIGRRFEEVGQLSQEEWNSEFGPFDEFGQVVPTDSLPLAIALREGLPANGEVRVRVRDEDLVDLHLSALPLVTAQGFQGALVAFWRPDADDGE
jgi:PAS domain-containing protein